MKEDEIDLIQFYVRFTKSSFSQKIKGAFDFIFSNRFWFLLFLLLGAGYGYYQKTLQHPIYRSEMLIKSKLLNNSSCDQLIKSLETSIGERNIAELKNIGVSDAIKSIKSIEFIYPTDKDDLLKKTEPFKLVISTDDNSKFEEIEKSIFNYLKNNPYSLADENRSRDVLTKNKVELENKIAELESMEKILLNYIQVESKQLTQSIDLTSITNEKTQTKLQLINIENQLSNVSNFEILQKITPTNVGYSSKKPIYVWSFLAFILGGAVLSVFKKTEVSTN
jgi:uncharacterized protein involved in exopolysaccharide biosynthesis